MGSCCSRSEEERRDFSDCFLAGEERTPDGLGLPSCLNTCGLQRSNVLLEICLEKMPNGHRLLKWVIGNVFVIDTVSWWDFQFTSFYWFSVIFIAIWFRLRFQILLLQVNPRKTVFSNPSKQFSYCSEEEREKQS